MVPLPPGSTRTDTLCPYSTLFRCIWDITTDLEIPAFYVLLFDRQADASHLGIGSGCHLCPEVALLRAITEAAQVRTTYLSGARDDLREDDFDPDRKSVV